MTAPSVAKEAPAPSAAGGLPPIWAPLLLLAAASVAFRFGNLDHTIQHWFWSADGDWRFDNSLFVDVLYRYGNIPALLVASGGLVVWSASLFVRRLKPARSLGGFLALALIVGPGLLVNGLLKEHYGRPRPRQVVEFDGSQQFRSLGEPTFNSWEKSFPSGHASMGFFWFVPAIYFWPRSRNIAWGLIGLALLHGGLMGLGRMAQGAHWPSDVFWSAGIVYVSAWLLYRVRTTSAQG